MDSRFSAYMDLTNEELRAQKEQHDREVRRARTLRYLQARQAVRSGLICSRCGNSFDAERRGAKTCSNACRQAMHRKKALRLSGGSKT
jgi:hypothetical protein